GRVLVRPGLFAIFEERRADATQRDDVLSLLLAVRNEDGSPMSRQELRDELMTLLVAGHETTASELAFAFERLVRNPAVLERLTEEIAGGQDDAPGRGTDAVAAGDGTTAAPAGRGDAYLTA